MSTVVTPQQVDFSAGEISPLLHQRRDFAGTQRGLATCRGFIPIRQGGFTRAPGTLYRGRTRSDQTGILVGFEFARDDAMVLEFTPLKLRFWRYGQPVLDGPDPYEIDTPWDAADLSYLQYQQDADVIYIADGVHPHQKLSRFALNNWTLAPVNFLNGPFRNRNLDEASTVQCSAATGSITITASVAIFQAGQVGSLLLIEPVDLTTPLWTQNVAVTVGQLMRYDGRTYELIEGTNTLGNPPEHIEGTQKVSLSPAVSWKFIDDGKGIVRITGFSSATSVTATVLRTVPKDCVTGPTYRWSEGAWSDIHGYPAALAIADERLCAAATLSDPRTVFLSIQGAYEDFEASLDPDGAFSYKIGGQRTQNRVISLSPGTQGLLIFALGEELAFRSTTSEQGMTPLTSRFAPMSGIGSFNARPIMPFSQPIWISKDGTRLFEASPAVEGGGRVPPLELSLIAEHIAARGLREIHWAGAPHQVAVLRLADGDLAFMLYNPDGQLPGWCTVPLAGGLLESLTVTPDETGTFDEITLMVVRDLAEGPVRTIETVSPIFGTAAGLAVWAANHAYCAVTFASEPAQASFSVPHLAEQEVWAWTEQGQFGPLMVGLDGEVTLPDEVNHATIGLLDQTHYADTLPAEGASPQGDVRGRQVRLTGKTGVCVHHTAQGYIRTLEQDLGQALRVGSRQRIVPQPVAGALTQVYTGVGTAPSPTGHAQAVALRFEPDGLAPMTITGVIPAIQEAGR